LLNFFQKKNYHKANHFFIPEPIDQWVWITHECFPGLYCHAYIWANLLLYHLLQNEPHRWLATCQMPYNCHAHWLQGKGKKIDPRSMLK
jgi:hypothetical protein